MNDFKIKTDIIYGENSINNIQKIKGNKIFIVTDATMIRTGTITKITYMLDNLGVDWFLFSDVKPDPTMDIVENGLKKLVDFVPDTVITLGGGSSIDTAKAIIYFYKSLLSRISSGEFNKKLEFIAIPTTSGTGSEVTSYSVITDEKTGVKIPLVDDNMLPDIAILDSNLTKTVPKNVIAHTGMDVLTHGIEAYVATNRSEFSNAYGLKAIELVYKNLLSIYDDDDKIEDEKRCRLHQASTMAGIAFNNAGLGINHSLAHAIGGTFHLPHGMTNAILLPYIIKFNSRDELTRKRYGEIASMLGFPEMSDDLLVEAFIRSIEILKEKMGIPRTLKDADINEEIFIESLDELASKAINDFCTKTTPLKAGKEELKEILREVYFGK